MTLVVLAGALTVAACGDGDGGGDGGAGAPTVTSAPPDPTASASTPSASLPDFSASSEPAPPATAPSSAEPVQATQPTVPVPTAGPPPPTTIPLPQPVAPPPDDGSTDPELQLGRMAIPKIGIDSPLYEGIRLPTFDRGPGHWPGSAMPGQRGNMIIGGHRTKGNADFRNIDQLAPGDEVVMTMGDGAVFTYVVTSSEIVDPFAAQVLYQTPETTATLFACHPPGSVAQRIVVHLALAT